MVEIISSYQEPEGKVFPSNEVRENFAVNNSSPRAEGSLFSNSAITSHLLERGYPQKSIDSMDKCGISSGFKSIKHCPCETEIISFTHHCNLRTCPRCSKVRKRKIFRRYLPVLKKLHQDRKNFLYFLTISPKNYKDLEKGLKHIRESFNRFSRHKYLEERVLGGFYVIEAKGTEGNWNVHIHAIIYGRWLDNKVRTQKDSKIVRLFMQSSKVPVNIHITRQNSARFTLNYMLKYISSNKDDFQTPEDVAKYILVTRKKRLIHAFGSFYKLKIEKEELTCYKCGGRIEYLTDMGIIYFLEQDAKKLDRMQQVRELDGPPPPPNNHLEDYLPESDL